MCGITGILNFHEAIANTTALISMNNSIANRGPDDEGYLLFNQEIASYYGDTSMVKNTSHIHTALQKRFRLGFGFRQLKIIDLSNNSHQPMVDRSNCYAIVFNGELYNFKELKTELSGLGYSFFSNSDTEVVLNAYKEWKEKALQKFNGMFAFAIFNKRENQVFIARDRIGIKPLFYHHSNTQFLFGSTIKSIIESKLYSPEICWNGLSQNFKFSTAQSPNTCFKDIVSLEPGHYLTIQIDTTKVFKQQYWEVPTNIQDFSLTQKKATELIQESLYDAVKKRLVSDVELGSFMSGGIDSTTISVIASKFRQELKVLTLGFLGEESYNEIPQAKDTANLHQLQHHVSYVNPTEIISQIDAATLAYEEPYYHLAANFMLAKIASENKLKVVLSGLGGDELFGGYDVFKKLPLWQKYRKQKHIISAVPNLHPKIRKAKQIVNYNSIDALYTHYYENFNEQQINSLFNNNLGSIKNTIGHFYKNKHGFTDDFEALSFYHLKSYIGNHQMRAVDRTTMAFSIEGRFPLLDHTLIETAFKIPTKFKTVHNISKYPLRKVAESHIAKSCLNMRKKGLSLPLKNWLKKDLKSFSLDHISALKNRGLFNNTAIDNMVKNNDETKIWQLVSTEIWLEKFM